MVKGRKPILDLLYNILSPEKRSEYLFNEPMAEYILYVPFSELFHNFYQIVTRGFNHEEFRNRKTQPLVKGDALNHQRCLISVKNGQRRAS